MLGVALAVSVFDPSRTRDDDRDAIRRLIVTNVPVVLAGPDGRRADLERYAAALEIASPRFETIADPMDVAQCTTLAAAVDVPLGGLYVIVDTDRRERDVRDAGAVPLHIGTDELPTIRDAVASLSGPILRAALHIRGVISDRGIDA